MTETTEAIKIHRGLKGVYFDRSPCTFIDGKAGDLRYRGYSIHDLAEHSTFETVAAAQWRVAERAAALRL
jgi:citrate synthase